MAILQWRTIITTLLCGDVEYMNMMLMRYPGSQMPADCMSRNMPLCA